MGRDCPGGGSLAPCPAAGPRAGHGGQGLLDLEGGAEAETRLAWLSGKEAGSGEMGCPEPHGGDGSPSLQEGMRTHYGTGVGVRQTGDCWEPKASSPHGHLCRSRTPGACLAQLPPPGSLRLFLASRWGCRGPQGLGTQTSLTLGIFMGRSPSSPAHAQGVQIGLIILFVESLLARPPSPTQGFSTLPSCSPEARASLPRPA